MQKPVLVSIILMFLTACRPSVQIPPANPTPTPSLDLGSRFVEVPANQPFRYSVVAAGVFRVTGGLGAALSNVGPAYNNLRVLPPVSGGRFLITYDGYTQPNQDSNLIVKALAEGANQRGPYVVFVVGFNAGGVELGIRDLTADGPPSDLDTVKVMVEISQYVRTN